MDEELFPFDSDRRNQEMVRYGWNTLPRAAALLKAFLTHDLNAIHALGPAEPEEKPTGWLDPLDYGPDQAKFNPDHELIFAQLQLIVRLAREWQVSPQALHDFLEHWTRLPPSDEIR
jgi:hypothetical protein